MTGNRQGTCVFGPKSDQSYKTSGTRPHYTYLLHHHLPHRRGIEGEITVRTIFRTRRCKNPDAIILCASDLTSETRGRIEPRQGWKCRIFAKIHPGGKEIATAGAAAECKYGTPNRFPRTQRTCTRFP